MKKALILILMIAAGTFAAWKISDASKKPAAEATAPGWLESDSAAAIHSRLLYDFPWNVEEARPIIKERYPELSDARIDSFIELKYIETLMIDGTLRVHRKAPRNLALLNPAMSGETGRGTNASEQRISYVDSVLDYYRGANPLGLAHKVTYRFSIDVPYHEALAGDSLRVWLPLPLDSDAVEYQSDVEILTAEPANYILAGQGPTPVVHNSIYMTMPAPAAEGDTAHFEYVGRFTARGMFKSREEIAADMLPYDTTSELYRRYTSFESPHIVRLDSLARAITGDETNPLRQSEMVFDYIQRHYPWAGAREYSTIDCIPTYVIEQGHGDCGQVSLLYISLMRTLGVPAKWVSGWMLHPGEVNFHDWAGVYFEGVGWLPVDASFGLYENAGNPEARTFYSHGIDSHRMCINTGVCGSFYPEKRFVRSETVDFQAGEVESSKGNLFYPGWDFDMEIISVEPIETTSDNR